jgi:hypothetical protein
MTDELSIPTRTGLSIFYPTSNFETLRDFLADNEYKPISFSDLWSATNVAGGSVVVNNFAYAVLRTSATINSSTLYRMGPLWGFNVSDASTLFDWSKKSSFFFKLSTSSDTEAVRRIQFKETNSTTIAALAVRGVGLQLDNLALTGEGYGTSRGTVSLATTLTAGVVYRIEIRLTSTGVEFFVNNVSKGSLTTAGKFPTVIATAECDAFCTNANGAAGTNTDLGVGNMAILQAV